jgi:hypothetical protein
VADEGVCGLPEGVDDCVVGAGEAGGGEAFEAQPAVAIAAARRIAAGPRLTARDA